MSDIVITISTALASQQVAVAASGTEAPPPDNALGGQAAVTGLGEQGPPPAELGAAATAEAGEAPAPEDAMGLANGAHFTSGESAPAPIPLDELDNTSSGSAPM